MSSNNRYNIYLRQIQDLAETLVIKSELTAERINNQLILFGGAGAVNLNRPSSWKYYSHLAGEYHDTDTMMHVTSLDTMEVIEFSKEMLHLHKATASAYQYGTRQYKELVDKYSAQERLILGILYPCDIDAAIAAPDNAILMWPAHLVESNEYSLISKLGDWINRYQTRWDNAQYNITDELYKATQLGIMYVNLVPAILNLRLAACRTNEAHSFHVFHYLASHGFNEYFFQFFTTKQSLFFYRNIAYIEHNSGSRDNLNWLIEKVMTERNLPIAEFLMSHDLSMMKESGIESMTPTVMFQRIALNLTTQQLGSDTCDLAAMLLKENSQARDNAKYRIEDTAAMTELMTYSAKNKLQTKVFESYVVDYSNSAVYPFEWIMLNHWIFCANEGILKNYVVVNNPKTGERMTMTSKEALLLYFYAFAASCGIRLMKPPEVVAARVTRVNKPSLDELMRTVDTSVFPATSGELIRVRQPLLRSMISSQAFYEFGRALYTFEEWQVRFIASHDGRMARAFAKNTVNGMYSDTLVDLNDGTIESYAKWFDERNINIDAFTTDDFTSLYAAIFRNATGIDRNAHVTTRSIQRAMIDVMKQLSSYSVQYIADITDSNIVFTNLDSVRLDTILHVMDGNMYGGEPGIVAKDMRSVMVNCNVLDTQTRFDEIGGVTVGQTFGFDQCSITMQDNAFYYEQRLNLSGVTMQAEATPSSDPEVITVPGVEETYNILSQSQRAMLRNAYEARRFVDYNLYAVFIPKKTFASFMHLGLAKRVYTEGGVDPTEQVKRSMSMYKVRLELPLQYATTSLSQPSVMLTPYELAHADLARIYGPFEIGSAINPWETVTLDQPVLNNLTLSATQVALLLNRIVLSDTY